MAVYRNIALSFWTDRKIDEEFTPEDKYFYLYLLSNPHTNICGCYEITLKQMSNETGYTESKIKHLLEKLEKVHNVIRYDKSTKEIFIINFSKYNWSSSEKFKKAVFRVGEKIKSPTFKNFIFELANNNIYPKDIYNNTVTVTVPVTDTVTETDTVTDTDTDTVVSIPYTYGMHTVSKSNKFIKPTVEEIKNYCFERKNNINAEQFFDFYEANGWVQGKQGKPIKDWKAAVRLWERNQYNDNQVGGKSSQDNLIIGADGFFYDENGEKYI